MRQHQRQRAFCAGIFYGTRSRIFPSSGSTDTAGAVSLRGANRWAPETGAKLINSMSCSGAVRRGNLSRRSQTACEPARNLALRSGGSTPFSAHTLLRALKHFSRPRHRMFSLLSGARYHNYWKFITNELALIRPFRQTNAIKSIFSASNKKKAIALKLYIGLISRRRYTVQRQTRAA